MKGYAAFFQELAHFAGIEPACLARIFAEEQDDGAEDDRRDIALTRPHAHGGYGLDGVWADDFHHCLPR